MFPAPPPQPPPLAWIAQPDREQLVRAESIWAPDGFLAAMKPGGAIGAMSCLVLADGRLDGCQATDAADAAPALRSAMLHLASAYRLDPASRPAGSRVTVTASFPRLFDTPPKVLSRPSAEEVAKAAPPGARGDVGVVCRVELQGLAGCVAEAPLASAPAHDSRMDAAAVALVSRFEVRPGTLNGVPVMGYDRFGIHFGPRAVITRPDWVRKPTQAELTSALPAAASDARKNGRATVQCRVLASGGLDDCSVTSESPTGYGFGGAAMMLTRLFVMKPSTVDGQPVTGAWVDIPIKWEMGEGEPSGASLTGETFAVLPWVPWVKAPTAAEVAAAFPRRADTQVFGHVTLRCGVTAQGAPRGCETQLEEPSGQGFGDAAQKLSQKFQADMSEFTPLQRRAKVLLTLDFSAQALAPAPGRYVRSVDWTRSFDAQRAQAVYPEAAIKAGALSGRAVADCRIAEDGALDACTVSTETPPDMGFGAAAIRLAQAMRANLWTQDGEPTAGERVRLPVHLIYAGEPKATAAARPH